MIHFRGLFESELEFLNGWVHEKMITAALSLNSLNYFQPEWLSSKNVIRLYVDEVSLLSGPPCYFKLFLKILYTRKDCKWSNGSFEIPFLCVSAHNWRMEESKNISGRKYFVSFFYLISVYFLLLCGWLFLLHFDCLGKSFYTLGNLQIINTKVSWRKILHENKTTVSSVKSGGNTSEIISDFSFPHLDNVFTEPWEIFYN